MLDNKHFSEPLLAWFDQYGRHNLPWQQDSSPYHVWLSEIMLQQTQVNTVIPYYLRFTEKFPDINSLANAKVDQVLALWTGLGYYARARNLHKTAGIVVAQYQAKLPEDLASLMALPGIGRSTAGAIMALAYQRCYPILDGNVKRVLTRYAAITGWPGNKVVENKLWQYAEQLLPQQRFADYIQAQMDLGATLCTRSKPNCLNCPINANCQAYSQGNPSDYPTAKPKKSSPTKKTHWLVFQSPAGKLLLEQRANHGIWGGLWSFPELENADQIAYYSENTAYIKTETITRLTAISHVFSHFKLDIQPHLIKATTTVNAINDNTKQRWYTIEQALQLGLPAPVKQLIIKLREHL